MCCGGMQGQSRGEVKLLEGDEQTRQWQIWLSARGQQEWVSRAAPPAVQQAGLSCGALTCATLDAQQAMLTLSIRGTDEFQVKGRHVSAHLETWPF